MKNLARSEEGQTVPEYILLLAIIVSGILLVFQGLAKLNITDKLMAPITGNFSRAYRYGNTTTKGYDDGGPYNHPRVFGGDNFRIFINPDSH